MINTDNIMQMVSPPTSAPIDENYHTYSLPLVGRIRFVKDNEGRMFVSGILAYWVYGSFSTYYIILEPAYNDDLIPAYIIYFFMAVSLLCLLALSRATFTNPGRLPNVSLADETWNHCKSCNRMRPPRAHHCRRCGQCVMRMDHHCPWVNNCVGEGNHFAFFQLLLYAFLLSFLVLVFNMFHFWVFPKCVNCNKNAFHIKHSIWFMYLLFILALNMVAVMGGMLWHQHLNLLLNLTTLERMSGVGRDGVRRCCSAYRELCGLGFPLFWLCPLGRRRPVQSHLFQQNV